MKGSSIVFRADASIDIGTGHVMRCLTLADMLRAQGAACRFVCREHRGHLFNLIRGRGFAVEALPVGVDALTEAPGTRSESLRHSAWLGADWTSDATETMDVLARMRVDWLVVDHYALDARWERRLASICRNLMVIDDLADRPHECNLLVDQNLGRSASDYGGLIADGCRLLLGPGYALLRPEFAQLRSYSLERREVPRIQKLLIAMGGVDKDNVTEKVLDALTGCVLPEDCRITVVLGEHAPWLNSVIAAAARMPWPTSVAVNVGDVAALMADSDLAIGAAGATAWERCCLGLPTLALVLADNQRNGARALKAAGAVTMLDDASDFPSAVRAKLLELGRPETLMKMQVACSAITDGLGALRVCAEMGSGASA